MISLFFRINRGKSVIRMVIEECVTIPAAILFTASAVYDHKKQHWIKIVADSPEDVDPETFGEIAHTFFHPLGLAWHIVGDNRFTRNFRTMCARIAIVNAKIHLQDAPLHAIESYLKSGCYAGTFVDKEHVVQDHDSAYAFFPL